MTDNNTPHLKRRLVAPFGEDPDELFRLRAQFLAELADWILTHPLPARATPPLDSPPIPSRSDPRPGGLPERRAMPPLDGAKPA
ncbi:MAG TPA: hypothetical protein VI547_03400 [Anaerolineales bacterium]|nr:hypothetical protein [Anaerolineales bacterium]